MRVRWWVAGFSCLAVPAGILGFFYGAARPAAHGAAGTPRSAPPNVLLISLDTTRPDHLGCYSYERNTSPNLDRLARGGVLFRQARCQTPLTLPSHMALFTSMLPSHNTVDHIEALLPSGVPTMAQLFQSHGYTTAALVNNAQMKGRWGFHRGFGLWREFREMLPEGDCEHITTQALSWLDQRGSEPFFLFLHYYDPHAHYNPPAQYREQFGSTLAGPQANRAMAPRRPEDAGPSRTILGQLIGSYDGEIAWMDHELGRLFEQLPDNTLVVVLSDHGEPFKEHGWLAHGATLYEEDIRTALFLYHPTLLPHGVQVDAPVMLLDVLPTVLNLCGIQPPPHCEGIDLGPCWQGGHLPERHSLAENKAVYDWCVQKMAQLGPWKLIYSLFDGKRELYRLPDEHTERSAEDPVMAEALFAVIRDWMDQEDYWIVYANGPGDFCLTVKPEQGQCTHQVQIGDFDAARNGDVVKGPNHRWMRWAFSQPSGMRGLYFQVVPPRSGLHFHFEINGKPATQQVFLGPAQRHPRELPWKPGATEAIAPPVIDKAFKPAADGFYVMHHRGKKINSISPLAAPLDDKTIEQLRSLGYLQ